MNKAELLSSIAEKSKLSKVESERALNAFIQTVEQTLAKGDEGGDLDHGRRHRSSRPPGRRSSCRGP